MHFKAGYIVDSVAQLIKKYRSKDVNNTTNHTDKINGLLKYVSSFDAQLPFENRILTYKLPF